MTTVTSISLSPNYTLRCFGWDFDHTFFLAPAWIFQDMNPQSAADPVDTKQTIRSEHLDAIISQWFYVQPPCSKFCKSQELKLPTRWSCFIPVSKEASSPNKHQDEPPSTDRCYSTSLWKPWPIYRRYTTLVIPRGITSHTIPSHYISILTAI